MDNQQPRSKLAIGALIFGIASLASHITWIVLNFSAPKIGEAFGASLVSRLSGDSSQDAIYQLWRECQMAMNIFWILGIGFGIVGIILAVQAGKRGNASGIRIVGLVLSILGFVTNNFLVYIFSMFRFL